LGTSLPPAELARRDSGVFEEMKYLFSITPEARKGGESPECLFLKNFNRTLDRTRSRMDLRVRSALVEGRGTARLGFVTGRWSGLTSASGQFTWAQRKGACRARDRRVRRSPGPERLVSYDLCGLVARRDRTLWRVRSRAIGRVRSCGELSGL
jgi:hypothetical protein